MARLEEASVRRIAPVSRLVIKQWDKLLKFHLLQFPYSKRSKIFHPNNEEMTETDRKWHASFKPHFTESGAVLYQTSKQTKDEQWEETAIASQGNAVIVLGQHTNDKVS